MKTRVTAVSVSLTSTTISTCFSGWVVLWIMLFIGAVVQPAFTMDLQTNQEEQIVTQSPQDRTESFRQANQLVKEGRPADAISIYEELLSIPDGLLYYNTGVAYQLMGKLGAAKAMYLAASYYPVSRESSLEALEQLEALLPFKMAKIPRYPWQKVYDYFIEDLGIPFLFGFAAFGLYLFAGGLIGQLFSTYKKASLTAMISGTLIAIGMGSILLARHVERQQFQTGVVTVSSVTLIENPDLGVESTTLAYEGAVIRADLRESRAEEGWYFVTLQNGAQGWLMENNFKAVPF